MSLPSHRRNLGRSPLIPERWIALLGGAPLGVGVYLSSVHTNKRGIVRKMLCLLVLVSALALGGCGTPSAAEEGATTAPATPTSNPTGTPTPSFSVSEAATCMLLIGPNEDGPLIQYVNVVSKGAAASTEELAKGAAALTAINDAAKTANPEMKQLLTQLNSPDVTNFKAAGIDLLTRCPK